MGGWGKIKKFTYLPHEMSSILISVNFHPKEPFGKLVLMGGKNKYSLNYIFF